MRDIKFRIWNSHGRVMHAWPELVEKNKIHLLNAKNPTYTVMQFTGLTDVHGVEIYEGDILHHLDPYGWSPMPVIFHDGAFMVAPLKNLRLRFLVHLTSSYVEENGLVLAGNLHENPELLEE